VALVRRKLTADESARLKGLGIQNPWANGPARFGTPSIDEDRCAMVVGLGGGNMEVPNFWALVMGRDVLILDGRKMPGALPPDDHRLLVRVDTGWPVESPLWELPDLYRILKEGLFQLIAIGEPYRPGVILFAGGVGDLIEEA
jgi:hypothetical protein